MRSVDSKSHLAMLKVRTLKQQLELICSGDQSMLRHVTIKDLRNTICVLSCDKNKQKSEPTIFYLQSLLHKNTVTQIILLIQETMFLKSNKVLKDIGREESIPGVSSFPEKLMMMINWCESQEGSASAGAETIRWLSAGNGFVIFDPNQLSKSILPRFFKVAKYESFTRKLYRWGFRQYGQKEGISSNVESGARVFHAKYFHRDTPKQCASMTIKYSRKEMNKLAQKKSEITGVKMSPEHKSELQGCDRMQMPLVSNTHSFSLTAGEISLARELRLRDIIASGLVENSRESFLASQYHKQSTQRLPTLSARDIYAFARNAYLFDCLSSGQVHWALNL